MSYGERFKQVRQAKGLTQEAVAKRLHYLRPAPVSLLERKSARIPKARTIKKHAEALGCEPWELLAGVPTDYDRLRARSPLSDEELDVLLWGLAYLPPDERDVMFDTMQGFVDAILPGATPSRNGPRAPARHLKAKQIHPGKKLA